MDHMYKGVPVPGERVPMCLTVHPPSEVVEEAMVGICRLHLVSKTQGWRDKSFSVLPSCPETLGWLMAGGHCPVREQ